VCCRFVSRLKSIALAGFEFAIFGSSGKLINHYTTKPTFGQIVWIDISQRLSNCGALWSFRRGVSCLCEGHIYLEEIWAQGKIYILVGTLLGWNRVYFISLFSKNESGLVKLPACLSVRVPVCVSVSPTNNFWTDRWIFVTSTSHFLIS
jgi:hypothetical protein